MCHVPAAFAELDGAPVEEFRVRRGLTHDAEFLRAVLDADAEEFLPHAIDGHARGERVGGVDEPFGEAEAVLRRVLRHRMQRGEDSGAGFVLGLIVLAAVEDARRSGRARSPEFFTAARSP